jgi:carboxylesterase type B
MRHFLCLILIAGLASGEDVKVKSEKGVIKGTRIDHDFGQYYYAFRGIRYAKPPTEELRFMVNFIYLSPNRKPITTTHTMF